MTLPDARTVTTWFMLGNLVATLLLDAYMRFVIGSEATISVIFYEATKAHPVIAFVAGIACGHIFWPVWD